ncbi:hypothetical protein O3G_MSEX002003 [Manduca sexta]|uniref:HTH psq-type domain-containing protein n=1 Tax=Manduca sexta TaxID=7130 RepID=A0A921YM55_MANSE|nr:hypothetical protein O3G_MSEX002003 [Manduca sexta]
MCNYRNQLFRGQPISTVLLSDSTKLPSKRAMWSEENLRAAMEAITEGKMSQYAAAEFYNIPRTTLRDHLLSGSTVKRTGRYPTLNREQEKQLLNRLRDKNKRLKLTTKMICREAFIFCEEYNLKHNFNKNIGLAGRDWLKPFLERHPEIFIVQK